MFEMGKSTSSLSLSFPMMTDLYAGETRDIPEGFHLYRGKGEIFDLSVEPRACERFAFGGGP